jgi:hypothetical protein
MPGLANWGVRRSQSADESLRQIVSGWRVLAALGAVSAEGDGTL